VEVLAIIIGVTSDGSAIAIIIGVTSDGSAIAIIIGVTSDGSAIAIQVGIPCPHIHLNIKIKVAISIVFIREFRSVTKTVITKTTLKTPIKFQGSPLGEVIGLIISPSPLTIIELLKYKLLNRFLERS
jgi:hypothetical protein